MYRNGMKMARRYLSTIQSTGFDAELVAVYKKLSDQHRHPNGPWPLMVNKCQSILSSKTHKCSILDIASGPGQPGISIAEAMPGATIFVTDASEDMIEKAKAASAHLPNVTVSVTDAENLAEFADHSVDVVTCCYGYMFPKDKDKALAETYRVLKPGGSLIATTWDDLDILKISRDIMTAVLGHDPPAPEMNPMSLSEPGLFESMVQKAGFTNLDVSTSTYPFDLGAESEFQLKVGTILLKDKLDELNAHDTARTAFLDNIMKYAQTTSDGSMVLPNNTFKLTIATK